MTLFADLPDGCWFWICDEQLITSGGNLCIIAPLIWKLFLWMSWNCPSGDFFPTLHCNFNQVQESEGLWWRKALAEAGLDWPQSVAGSLQTFLPSWAAGTGGYGCSKFTGCRFHSNQRSQATPGHHLYLRIQQVNERWKRSEQPGRTLSFFFLLYTTFY